jgi:hypothetical protein
MTVFDEQSAVVVCRLWIKTLSAAKAVPVEKLRRPMESILPIYCFIVIDRRRRWIVFARYSTRSCPQPR